MIGLVDTATVLGPDEDGDFTVTIKSALACRFAIMSQYGQGALSEPGGPTADRRLLWGADYELPGEFVRIVVEESNSLPTGTVFQLVPGSYAVFRGPSNAVTLQRAYLVRAG